MCIDGVNIEMDKIVLYGRVDCDVICFILVDFFFNLVDSLLG